MQLWKLTLIYLFAIIACTFLLLMDIPKWQIFILLFLYVFLFTMYPHFNALLWTNNLKKVERFLEVNKHKALYAYPYAIANQSVAEQKAALDKIITTYKQPYVKHNYASILAILENNYDQALSEAKQIAKEPFHSYMVAHSEAYLGNFEQAEALLPKLTQKWMSSSIESLIFFKRQDKENFKHYSTKAIKQARGIQKYLLTHSFQEMEEKLK
ncbi:hypothetical protein [Rummeliibacillus pycnus]|uniref:hypothetical protein n=1 Tax=Rummeliibacillus pycnus TaxID=101070 RepID=UPI0037C5B2E9